VGFAAFALATVWMIRDARHGGRGPRPSYLPFVGDDPAAGAKETPAPAKAQTEHVTADPPKLKEMRAGGQEPD
jgi:hypothetical protein